MKKKIFSPPMLSFTNGEITEADMCARELWRGYEYHSNCRIISDEIFLKDFNNIGYIRENNLLNNFSLIEEDKALDLLIASKLGSGLRFRTLDVRKGIAGISRLGSPIYKNWLTKKHNPSNFWIDGSGLIIQIGREFNSLAAKKAPKGIQAAVSSRILFYSMPEMVIFPYSVTLAKKLKVFDDDPQKSVKQYSQTMAEAYYNNWKILEELKMPLPKILSDQEWEKIRNSGWWQRRVLDLCVVLRFKLFDVKGFVKTIMTTKPKIYP